jgi:hypothetical protein
MRIFYAALVLAVSGASACGASTGETSAPGATTQSPCRVGYLPQDSCLAGTAPTTAAPTTAAPSPSRRRSGTIGTAHTVTIATFTGHGDRSPVPRLIRTSGFTIRGNGNWVLKYSYDCAGQLGGEGNFAVNEDAMSFDNPSAVAINRLDSGGHGSWHVHGDAGRHYLEILTECPYKITVVQKY